MIAITAQHWRALKHFETDRKSGCNSTGHRLRLKRGSKDRARYLIHGRNKNSRNFYIMERDYRFKQMQNSYRQQICINISPGFGVMLAHIWWSDASWKSWLYKRRKSKIVAAAVSFQTCDENQRLLSGLKILLGLNYLLDFPVEILKGHA